MTWSESKFRQRLEIMRDLHQNVSDSNVSWAQPHDTDPWRDMLDIPTAGGGRRQSNDSMMGIGTLCVANVGICPADEPDAEPREPPLHGNSPLDAKAHQHLVSQHERALDFIARREAEFQRILKDMEMNLAHAQQRALENDAARDEAIHAARAAECELTRVAAERADLARQASETADAGSLARLSVETPAWFSRTNVGSLTMPVKQVSSPCLPAGPPRVRPWAAMDRSVSPPRVQRTTIMNMPTVVQRASVGESTIPAWPRSVTPPVRMVAPARSSSPIHLNAQSATPVAVNVHQTQAVNAALRGRVHGEVTHIRQEIKSLTDICHSLDLERPTLA